MEFRILGPLEIRGEGGVVPLGRSKPRAILALLLLHPNEPVSTSRLVAALWGDEAPARAVQRLHVHVSRLRKALGDSVPVTTTPGGYRLRVRPGELDAERFERLIQDGRAALAAGEPAHAADRLREALALWRGPPLADLACEPFAGVEIARLEEQRWAALEARVDADLAAGGHAALVAELQHLVAAEPTRERFAAQLMLALYRSRRQADALAVYRATRARLADELGLEPGEELRRLERLMLAQEPELEAPAAPAPSRRAAIAGDGARRVVSVVRVAVAEEALDPEALHRLLDGCWERCTAVIERHGGVVERIGGDALVGAFGLGELHEDDALRAATAAIELSETAGVAVRVGIATGEVFVGPGAAGAPFASGAPFTAAARLEAGAAAGDVLIAASTQRLVEPELRTEPAGRAWRVLGPRAERRRPPEARFVGRARELEQLRRVFARAAYEPGCRLVTLVGPPGIGKSRLARRLLDDVRGEATVAVGRCLSYGEGITYRPLAEIVRELGPELPARLLDERAARVVLGAFGAAHEPARAEETAWVFRRLFEAVAGERPLVVVFEDVHWAEPTLLELLEYVVAFSTASPLLIVCLARPELLERHPAWATPQPARELIVLDPLSAADSRALVHSLTREAAPARIIELAEGNPFFLEQLIAMQAEHGDDAELPPSVRAVLAARIHRLEPGERAVLQRAAVEGRSFHVGLLPEDGLARHLVSLAAKQLIRAERSEFAGEDAFRFAHALIREVAYGGLPKRRRAELHERVGRWLATKEGTPDEIIGFHLERVCRLRAELGDAGDRERALANEAAQRLATAARAALVRGELSGGARLLEHAASLLVPDDRARDALLPALGVALFETGRLASAERVLDEAVARAAAVGDRGLEARARVEQQFLRFHAGTHVDAPAARRIAASAVRVLTRQGDLLGSCRAWRLRAWIAWAESRVAVADAAWKRAAECAAAAGEQHELCEILGWRASASVFGATPVPEAIARCSTIRAQVRGYPVAEAVTLRPLALLLALQGDFDEARRCMAEANDVLGELQRLQSVVPYHEAKLELLADRPAAAEARLRPGYARLEAMGEHALLATAAALLAQAVLAQGRDEEAEALCESAELDAEPEDLVTHAMCRGVRARASVHRGDPEDAVALAREAVAFAARTDQLVDHGDACLALAEVLEASGRDADAEDAARDALALYERKGAVLPARRVRARLDRLQATTERS